jgi:hypothetical protein
MIKTMSRRKIVQEKKIAYLINNRNSAKFKRVNKRIVRRIPKTWEMNNNNNKNLSLKLFKKVALKMFIKMNQMMKVVLIKILTTVFPSKKIAKPRK